MKAEHAWTAHGMGKLRCEQCGLIVDCCKKASVECMTDKEIALRDMLRRLVAVPVPIVPIGAPGLKVIDLIFGNFRAEVKRACAGAEK